jgi:Cu+-exporting ATPase
LKEVSDLEDIQGMGVKATIDGKLVVIGSSEVILNLGINLPDIEYDGRVIWIALNNQLEGFITIYDIIQEHMTNLAEHIRKFGIERVILATGDDEEQEVKRVAEILNVGEYYHNFKPHDKADLVKKLQEKGSVIMVGDGVNDSLALATADVGIAIGGYKNINLAIKSADIIILGSNADSLLKILALCRKMKRVLKQDYTWAISFNLLGLIFSTIGWITPIIAAILHHFSSVYVVFNAARIYFQKNKA